MLLYFYMAALVALAIVFSEREGMVPRTIPVGWMLAASVAGWMLPTCPRNGRAFKPP